jgi:hypothetical protein
MFKTSLYTFFKMPAHHFSGTESHLLQCVARWLEHFTFQKASDVPCSVLSPNVKLPLLSLGSSQTFEPAAYASARATARGTASTRSDIPLSAHLVSFAPQPASIRIEVDQTQAGSFTESTRWLESPLASSFALLHQICFAAVPIPTLDRCCQRIFACLQEMPLSVVSSDPLFTAVALASSRHFTIDLGDDATADLLSSSDEEDRAESQNVIFQRFTKSWSTCGGADWGSTPLHAVVLQQLSLPVLAIRRKPWSLSFECTHSIRGHQSSVSSITFTSDGRWLISASYDKSIRVCLSFDFNKFIF